MLHEQQETESVRVVLASKADARGGAARAAYRLHAALRDNDVESHMVVDKSRSGDDRVVEGPERVFGIRTKHVRTIDIRLARMQQSANPVVHSPAVAPGTANAVIRRLHGDVLNLHWTGAGLLSVGQIGRLDVPVVWTFHDMWAFCGSEHYAPTTPDARWRTGYRRDNRAPEDAGLDLDRWVWRRKARLWRRPLQIVAPSNWLASCVRESALMADWPVHVIPNPLPVDVFRPHSRQAARRALGLPPDVPLILFGAFDGTADARKGFDLLVAALHQVTDRIPRAEAVVFGSSEPKDAPPLSLPVHWVGVVQDDATLSRVYSAADVMVVPSRQDNLPQTATEAQACGVPVVAFRTGGLADVVDDRETGYLAEPFDVADLAHGIGWVLGAPNVAERLGEQARRRACRLWEPNVIAHQYVQTYQEAIDRRDDDLARAHHRW